MSITPIDLNDMMISFVAPAGSEASFGWSRRTICIIFCLSAMPSDEGVDYDEAEAGV